MARTHVFCSYRSSLIGPLAATRRRRDYQTPAVPSGRLIPLGRTFEVPLARTGGPDVLFGTYVRITES